MNMHLGDLLPTDKIETEKAEALIALGYPAIIPVLPQILEWMQDINWPVAQVFQPFLVTIGSPLAPFLKPILSSKDEMWKHWILVCIVRESKDLCEMLKDELNRMANSPTNEEKSQELDKTVRSILERN